MLHIAIEERTDPGDIPVAEASTRVSPCGVTPSCKALTMDEKYLLLSRAAAAVVSSFVYGMTATAA
ncbi:uncharacterized protein BDW47DRAFT_97193 [Aspergillus candidus]|uniref:Uncharacterized protein n=1 Tax=Aspergillus candidus TaxID=41067 RepID=A0A2I2FP98_ASPCN|nr:hypothetical protein BDW47DRAFT_97193 [Aspergillus candidus]PLB42448.1 hypothetical protein BDW47DRAFT_97193 [Aspergillus candidus]